MTCDCGVEIPDELIRGPVRCSCGRWHNLCEHGTPPWVPLVAAWRRPGDRGVGDTFHRLAIAVGAERVARLVHWFGIDCGCDGRQELWNQQYPYTDDLQLF